MSIKTLPDYLQPGLDIIFVGINPGLYSAQVGHYFANLRNRFWAAFNAAQVTPEPLGPETDAEALRFGIGFTDVVKRPTLGISELSAAEFREGARVLQEKLMRVQPLVACFNGLTGYKNYLRYTDPGRGPVSPGLQPRTIGRSRVYVLPSTSPANGAVPLGQIVEGLRALQRLVRQLKEGHG